MPKTKEPEYRKMCEKYKLSVDARYDGTTGFIYFEGGRAFWKVDAKGDLDVRESWGEPTQIQAQRIFRTLEAFRLWNEANRVTLVVDPSLSVNESAEKRSEAASG